MAEQVGDKTSVYDFQQAIVRMYGVLAGCGTLLSLHLHDKENLEQSVAITKRHLCNQRDEIDRLLAMDVDCSLETDEKQLGYI